jgi:hypothetical protein
MDRWEIGWVAATAALVGGAVVVLVFCWRGLFLALVGPPKMSHTKRGSKLGKNNVARRRAFNRDEMTS